MDFRVVGAWGRTDQRYWSAGSREEKRYEQETYDDLERSEY